MVHPTDGIGSPYAVIVRLPRFNFRHDQSNALPRVRFKCLNERIDGLAKRGMSLHEVEFHPHFRVGRREKKRFLDAPRRASGRD